MQTISPYMTLHRMTKVIRVWALRGWSAGSGGRCYNSQRRRWSIRNALFILIGFLASLASAAGQTKLSVHWEELTAADFRSAIQQSQGTCLLPFGIIEKHGPHRPLGPDLLNVRYAALHAAEQE